MWHSIETHADTQTHTAAGNVNLKRGTAVRPWVQRVIMGPADLFSTTMIADDIEALGLQIWGILLQEGNGISAEDFRQSLGLPDEYVVGYLKKEQPDELRESIGSTQGISALVMMPRCGCSIFQSHPNSFPGRCAWSPKESMQNCRMVFDFFLMKRSSFETQMLAIHHHFKVLTHLDMVFMRIHVHTHSAYHAHIYIYIFGHSWLTQTVQSI